MAKKEVALPSLNAIPNVQGNTRSNEKGPSLFKSWGKLQDKNSLFLLDPRSTNNFISLEMAPTLQLK